MPELGADSVYVAASLFWDPPCADMITVAAGALDDPAGLRGAAHWFTDQAGAYYELPEDGLPRHARSGQLG